MEYKNIKLYFFLIVCFFLLGTNKIYMTDLKELTPPNPKKEPIEFKAHGIKRVDNYYWIRDDSRKKIEVINHLKSENIYLENWFKSGTDNRDKLFEEVISRIPKKEDSVPIPMGSYEYLRRYEPDKEHPIYVRKKLKSDLEEIFLDVNKLAKKSEFYQLANWSIAPSEKLLVFAEDTSGRRQYTIRIKDLSTDKFLEDILSGTSGDIAWSLNSEFLFYVLRDFKTAG